MHLSASPVVRAGVPAGALLYLHAWVPNSHAYPLLWPVAGGVLALYWAHRRSGTRLPLGRSVGIGLATGAVAGLVAMLLQAPTYLLLTTDPGGAVVRRLGGSGPLPLSLVAFEAITLALLLAIPAGLLGGLLSWPFVRAARLP